MCFVPFCVKASEWQVQKNVLSHESLRMKDFEKNMLGGGQEPVTVVQVVDNRRLILLNETLQYKHLSHSYAREYSILAPVLRSHTLKSKDCNKNNNS